jgi:hypothetical protein
MPPKEIITQNNIKNYFDYRAVGPGQLKPGMLISFRYQSPDRHIHDINPLVYIVERKADRVFGLNLHYHFGLMGGLILLKRKELEAKTGLNNTTNDPIKPNKPNQPNVPEKNTNPIHNKSTLPNPKLITAKPSVQQQQQDIAAAKAQERLGKQKPGVIQAPVQKQIIRIPPQLLEIYELQIEPIQILRNYLFPRMSGMQKLIFKP